MGGATRMACATPIMDVEMALLEALAGARSHAIAGDQLSIGFEGGELRFAAAPDGA
jgi:heat shock protein HslJ